MLDIIFDLFDLALLWQLKKKWEIPKEWSGTVENKKENMTPALSRFRYVVVFRTVEGQRKKLRMGKTDYDLYQLGRRYAKRRASICPTLIRRSEPQPRLIKIKKSARTNKEARARVSILLCL